MKTINGTLVILNGDCQRNLGGIYKVFIPCRNVEIAIEYVRGNGDILGTIPYTVDMDLLSDNERENVIDRMQDILVRYFDK